MFGMGNTHNIRGEGREESNKTSKLSTISAGNLPNDAIDERDYTLMPLLR